MKSKAVSIAVSSLVELWTHNHMKCEASTVVDEHLLKQNINNVYSLEKLFTHTIAHYNILKVQSNPKDSGKLKFLVK